MVVCRGSQLEGPATECAPYAGAGYRAGQAFPNDHVLRVILRKLVEVVSSREVPPRHFERNHRNLDHVQPGNEVVEHLETERMNDVLGVIEREDFEAEPTRFFEQANAFIDTVQ